MTPDAADWVAATVLTPAYLDSRGGLDLVRTCRCQYGHCGHCAAGRHNRCIHRRHDPVVLPQTYILARDGHVPHLKLDSGRWVPAEVQTVGRPCVWRCPCACPAPATEQLDLFAAAGAP